MFAERISDELDEKPLIDSEIEEMNSRFDALPEEISRHFMIPLSKKQLEERARFVMKAEAMKKLAESKKEKPTKKN